MTNIRSPFEMVFDSIADRYDGAISLSDLSLNDAPLVGVNGAFLKLTGYAEYDVIGKNCRFLQGQNSSSRAKSLLAESVARRTPIVTCITNYTKAGVSFANLLFLDFIVDDNGHEYSIGVQNHISKENWRNEAEAARFRSTNVLSLIKENTDRSFAMGKAWQSRSVANLVSSHLKALRAEELHLSAEKQMQYSEQLLKRVSQRMIDLDKR
ncbi:MAG: PAS domain-containing protein [Pseudomonadota bacterium]